MAARVIATSPEQFGYLAVLRLREAQILLRGKQWAGAMYISGYVAECWLKAFIARKHGGALPERFKVHDLETLRTEAAHYLDASRLEIVRRLPEWSHLLRYDCRAPSAQTVTRFLEACNEVHRCLSTVT